ncbi:MAG: DUF3105 domain-containing protein [Dehalococcoidia bacterium]
MAIVNREQRRQDAREQRRLAQQAKRRHQPGTPARPTWDKRISTSAGKAAESQPLRGSRRSCWWPLAAAGAVLAVLIALFFVFDPLGLRAPLPGTRLESQGNLHVNPSDTHAAYMTDPPASGPHFPTVPRRGIYTTQFVTEYLPHFMEHAGVEVQYNKTAPPDAVKKLTDIVNKELDYNIGQVILAPRPDMPCEVALTAWGRIAAFGESSCQPGSVGHAFDPGSSKDTALVKQFIERTMCAYDPENQCGGGAHGASKLPTPHPGEPTVVAGLGTATPSASPAATPGR